MPCRSADWPGCPGTKGVVDSVPQVSTHRPVITRVGSSRGHILITVEHGSAVSMGLEIIRLGTDNLMYCHMHVIYHGGL